MNLLATTSSGAYLRALEYLLEHGLTASPRGQRTIELENVVIKVTRPEFEPIQTLDLTRNEIIKKYTEREMALYRSGTLDAAKWRDGASKFWWGLRNPDDTVNSNYGALTTEIRDAPGVWKNEGEGLTQWEWAKTSILSDIHTRQAVMHFNRPMHQWTGNRDFPCTMYSMFKVRDSKLNYTVHMRSQDVVKGLVYDMPFFIWQLHQMARETNYPVGSYVHVVDSFHMYARDMDTVLKMLGEKQ